MPNQHTDGLGPIALQHRSQILELLRAGQHVDEIASTLDLNPSSISRHLKPDPEYQQAREDGTEQRLRAKQKRISSISNAGFDGEGNPLGISKEQSNLARVCVQELDAEQWFAEREHSARWGAKQQIEHTGPALAMATAALCVSAGALLAHVRGVTFTPQRTINNTPTDYVKFPEKYA